MRVPVQYIELNLVLGSGPPVLVENAWIDRLNPMTHAVVVRLGDLDLAVVMNPIRAEHLPSSLDALTGLSCATLDGLRITIGAAAVADVGKRRVLVRESNYEGELETLIAGVGLAALQSGYSSFEDTPLDPPTDAVAVTFRDRTWTATVEQSEDGRWVAMCLS